MGSTLSAPCLSLSLAWWFYIQPDQPAMKSATLYIASHIIYSQPPFFTQSATHFYSQPHIFTVNHILYSQPHTFFHNQPHFIWYMVSHNFFYHSQWWQPPTVFFCMGITEGPLTGSRINFFECIDIPSPPIFFSYGGVRHANTYRIHLAMIVHTIEGQNKPKKYRKLAKSNCVSRHALKFH